MVWVSTLFMPVVACAELSVEQQDGLKHLIRHDCGACHGMTLKGGLGSPLTAEKLQNKSPELLFNIIKDGVEGTPMPPWKYILNEQEISWIVRELKTGLSDNN